MEEDKNTLDLHTEVREEDRVAKAVALFKEGYNCSQSVVTAFADLYGFTRRFGLKHRMLDIMTKKAAYAAGKDTE